MRGKWTYSVRVQTMRIFIGLITLAVSLGNATASGQQPESVPPKDVIERYDVITSPPLPTPEALPSTGVILDKPGRVLVYGKPVKVRFQSPSDGISFQLRTGGTYSSISGVSYGLGWGWGGLGWGGYGWGGYGFGYGGVAPYYGEIVTPSSLQATRRSKLKSQSTSPPTPSSRAATSTSDAFGKPVGRCLLPAPSRAWP